MLYVSAQRAERRLMDESIDVAVRDEVNGRVVALARRECKSDPLIEVNDRQPVLERNTFDAFDVTDIPQRPCEQLGVRRAGNDWNRTRDCCRTIQLDI